MKTMSQRTFFNFFAIETMFDSLSLGKHVLSLFVLLEKSVMEIKQCIRLRHIRQGTRTMFGFE